MLRAVRRLRLLSLAALIALAGSVPVSISVAMHDGSDDGLHEPSLVLHDESAHRIGAPRATTTEPQHCAVCHWLQTLQTVARDAHVVERITTHQHVTIWSFHVDSRPIENNLPARAPPAV
jgi:hypothetical protein